MSKLPDANPTLTAYLVRQRRQAERQANSSAFARSGTSVTAEGVTTVDGINQSFDFDGTGPSDMGTKGWALGSTNGGPSWFIINGHMIFDDLMAQDASLTATVAGLSAAVDDIATLVGQQVTAKVASAVTQTGWATSTSMVSKAETTVTVPAGFTSALVTALGMVVFQDSAANRFDCRCLINGTAGPTVISLANLTGSASPSQTRVVSSLTGGQVLTIDVQVLSVVATGGMAANQAVITASVVFLR